MNKDDENMKDTWKAKRFSIDEIKKLNYDLGQCGYPSKEEIILPPKDTINNYIEKKELLDTQIKQKLDKIINILGDIKW